jgi:hypothetical protein
MKSNSIFNILKKHKTNIIIILLVLFCLNRCAVGCNRSNKLSRVEKQVDSLTAMISYNKSIIDSLNRDIAEYQNVIKLYKGFDQDKQNIITVQNKTQQEQLRTLRYIKNSLRKK